MSENNQKDIFYAISLGLELGFIIVIPLILFLLLGVFLDKKSGTFPLFIIVFVFLGLISTVFEVRYLVLPFLEKKVGKK